MCIPFFCNCAFKLVLNYWCPHNTNHWWNFASHLHSSVILDNADYDSYKYADILYCVCVCVCVCLHSHHPQGGCNTAARLWYQADSHLQNWQLFLLEHKIRPAVPLLAKWISCLSGGRGICPSTKMSTFCCSRLFGGFISFNDNMTSVRKVVRLLSNVDTVVFSQASTSYCQWDGCQCCATLNPIYP